MKGKRLYEMTVTELRAAAEAARSRGDERFAEECEQSISLNYRIAEAFQRSCRECRPPTIGEVPQEGKP